jgi:biopolymer transport protein ExbD
MVTTTFLRPPGVSLKLPETATREGAPESKKDLTLVVSKNGAILIDGKPRQEKEIRAQLKALAKRDKEARVLVKGDRSVLYQRMMEVMDLVRQSGLRRVVLPTDPKQTMN